MAISKCPYPIILKNHVVSLKLAKDLYITKSNLGVDLFSLSFGFDSIFKFTTISSKLLGFKFVIY
jgi:hypothetical protein